MLGGIAVMIGAAALLLALFAPLALYWERRRRRERYEGVVVGKDIQIHQAIEGPSEVLWVLELEDDTGKRFKRLVAEEFYNLVAVGDRVRKDPDAEPRRA